MLPTVVPQGKEKKVDSADSCAETTRERGRFCRQLCHNEERKRLILQTVVPNQQEKEVDSTQICATTEEGRFCRQLCHNKKR